MMYRMRKSKNSREGGTRVTEYLFPQGGNEEVSGRDAGDSEKKTRETFLKKSRAFGNIIMNYTEGSWVTA